MANAKSFFIGGTNRSSLTDLGLLLLRIVGGLSLAFGHGLGKVPPQEGFFNMVEGLGLPPFLAYGTAIAEFGGGILLALGFLTRPAALLIVINHTVVVFLAHAGDPFNVRELGVLFLTIAVLFLIIGSGRYSIDSMLRGRNRTDTTSGTRPVV